MGSGPIDGGGGTGGIIPPSVPDIETQTPDAGTDVQVFIDQIEEMLEGDDNLRLLAKGQISLPPGRISIAELTALINKVIQALKEEIYEQQQLDAQISERMHRNIAQTASSLEGLHGELTETVLGWRSATGGTGETVVAAHANLEQATAAYNAAMANVWGEDRAAIQEYNQAVQQYNNLDADDVNDIYNSLSQSERNALLSGLTQQQINDYGGTKQAVVAQHFNQKFQAYNDYVATRNPEVQAAIQNLQTATAEYNDMVDAYNANLDGINAERASYGLSTLPYMEKTPMPNPNLAYDQLPTTQVPVNAPLLPTPNRSTLNVPNSSQTGMVASPNYPGDPPDIETYEMMILHYIPLAMTTFNYLGSFNRALDLANEFIFANQFAIMTGQPLTLPFGFLERVDPVFLASVNAVGGIGLAAHALGLHSRTLEIALSRALFQTIAQNLSMPISARLFARLQFTALELLSRSALLSANPTLRFLASRFGFLSARSPAVQATIALAFAGQVGSLVSSGIVRATINGQINRLGFHARHSVRSAARNVQHQEQRLSRAIRSGNPFRIASAVNRVQRAHVRLANAVRLSNTFGALSIGGYAAFSNQVAAALNVSLLGVSTALFARTLGIPNLVPQVFAQITHLAPTDILIAMTAGATIRDVLDNPLSVLYMKQTLANTLVFQMGYSTGYAAAIVNHAINNVVLASVGLQSFGRLRNELYTQFRAEGLSPWHANRLANETTAMIRGDLGVQFLNVRFGLNVNRAIIATSIVSSLYGFDTGIAGAMLSNAVIRSLQYGGFGSRVQLRNDLRAQFQGMGLPWHQANALANNYVNFVETVGAVVPFSGYPGLSAALVNNALLRSLAFGGSFVRNEITADLLMRGLSPTQAAFVADQLVSVAEGNFVRPSDQLLFELTLNGVVERALLNPSYETQREFRDSVFNELRGAGFRYNDALFLANSIANYGVNGDALSLFGLSPAGIDVLNASLVDELRATGISGSRARNIVNQAYENTISRAPYFSPDDFQNALKEEVFKQTLYQTGRFDGHAVFDRAVANATDPSTILGLASLIEQINGSALGILRPDLGAELAQEIHHQLLSALLGGSSVDEISNEETRNPLSLLNQLNDQVERLNNEEDIANLMKLLKKLQELLAALTSPNAEHSLLGSNIMDAAGTFFGAANVSEGGQDFQPTQIPV